jgi:DNA-binding PadR family transcriptional regulator
VTRADVAVTRFAVLGQLALRTWSAYELTRSMRRTLHWFWPRAESGIYAEARRLEAEGLAVSRAEPAVDGSRRTRTVYEITDRGRERLREWLRTPPTTVQFVVEPFLRLHLARAGSLEDLIASVTVAGTYADELLATAAGVAEEFLDDRHLFQQDLALRGLLLEGLVGQALALRDWAAATAAELARWDDLDGDAQAEERARRAMRQAVDRTRAARDATRGE